MLPGGITVIEIELPLPAQSLHPNARVHFMAKAKATKKARHDAGIVAKQQAPPEPFREALVAPTFYLPRRRDGDNLNAWLKAYLDGLQDACIVQNDSQITLAAPLQVIGKERKVVLTITPLYVRAV